MEKNMKHLLPALTDKTKPIISYWESEAVTANPIGF